VHVFRLLASRNKKMKKKRGISELLLRLGAVSRIPIRIVVLEH
jgi:hypothetical protein